MSIREIVAEDKDDLLKLFQATGVFRQDEIEIANEVIEASLNPASGYRSFCFATTENRAIGYVCWGATPCTLGTFDLYWIAVHPDHQGNGVGKRLLSYAEERARKDGARLMIIETSSLQQYEKSRGFYRERGYQQLAVIEDFYQQGDHKIIYGKKFVS